MVEPLHETLLKPRKALPVRLRTIGEVEITKDALEIVLIVLCDIPKYCLVVTSTCRLVQRIDNLLEIVSDDFVYCTLLKTEISLIIRTLVVVQAILLTDKIIHVH